jgi:hypothetical protein
MEQEYFRSFLEYGPCLRDDMVGVGGLLRRRRSCKKKHLRKINTEATPKLPSRELRHSNTS